MQLYLFTMEKKILKLKKISIVIFGLMLVVLLMVEIWLRYIKSSWSVITLFYWLILIYLLFASFVWKLKADLLLGFGFISFVFGSVLSSLFPALTIGETIFRFSLIFWTVGVGLALIDYKKNE